MRNRRKKDKLRLVEKGIQVGQRMVLGKELKLESEKKRERNLELRNRRIGYGSK